MENKTKLDCGHPPTKQAPGSCGTGYGEDSNGKRFCYTCAAKRDRAEMKKTGRTVLYLTTGEYGDCVLTNWPGSLRLSGRFTKGRHNIARTRYDAWFRFDGADWHGVTYGDNTQLCHCRELGRPRRLPLGNFPSHPFKP